MTNSEVYQNGDEATIETDYFIIKTKGKRVRVFKNGFLKDELIFDSDKDGKA